MHVLLAMDKYDIGIVVSPELQKILQYFLAGLWKDAGGKWTKDDVVAGPPPCWRSRANSWPVASFCS